MQEREILFFFMMLFNIKIHAIRHEIPTFRPVCLVFDSTQPPLNDASITHQARIRLAYMRT